MKIGPSASHVRGQSWEASGGFEELASWVGVLAKESRVSRESEVTSRGLKKKKAMRFGNLENIHLMDKEIIYGKQEIFLYSQTALLR